MTDTEPAAPGSAFLRISNDSLRRFLDRKPALMAITCPKCGAGFDATLFQFGHGVRCDCGHWVELDRGHVIEERAPASDAYDEPRPCKQPPDCAR